MHIMPGDQDNQDDQDGQDDQGQDDQDDQDDQDEEGYAKRFFLDGEFFKYHLSRTTPSLAYLPRWT